MRTRIPDRRSPLPASTGRHRRRAGEAGVALLIALMATLLMTALGSTLVLLTMAETAITTNYRNSQEALYAADTGIERVVQDLLGVSQWSVILAGIMQSGFVGGTLTPTMPDGTPLDLAKKTTQLQLESDTFGVWGANNPVWRLYGHGPVNRLLPGGPTNSLNYVAIWVSDDPAETDGDPLRDGNGVLQLRAVGYGPSNTMKVIQVTLAQTSDTQIEPEPDAPAGVGVEIVDGPDDPDDPEDLGAPENFNDDVGPVGVRLLSWQELR